MDFDWEDYLTFAQDIKERPDEAAKRSAISRAYYCIFHRAKKYAIENLDYHYRPENPSHASMWRSFQNKGTTLNAIFNYGTRLKNFREIADYQDNFKNIDNSLVQVFQSAENALIYLKQIENNS
jgi:uncharacterized protein (UPF0332 family)